MRGERVTLRSDWDRLKEEAARRAYHLQLGEEIPESIRGEVSHVASHPPPKLLFNLTTSPKHDCIDETLDGELAYRSKPPVADVPVFMCISRLFELAQPEEAVLIFVEGASSGWEPLERRTMTLRKFLEFVYEYRDRPEVDVNGVYDITGQ